MIDAEAIKIIEKATATLAEHFDHVQILVTWNQNGTNCLKRGAGNWYARQGMAQEFITQDIAQEHATQLAQQINPEK